MSSRSIVPSARSTQLIARPSDPTPYQRSEDVKEVSEIKKTVEKTEKAVKASGESRLSKILNWFKNLPKRIAKPFRNMYYELKKVTWPSKEKLIAYSIIVLVFMLFMGIVIGLLDMGASALVRMLIA